MNSSFELTRTASRVGAVEDAIGSLVPSSKEFGIPDRPRWRPSGIPFSGRVWVGQKPKLEIDVSEAGATGFLYIQLEGPTHSWVESMPDSQPADGIVFDLSQTSGDIHIPGEIAPGG